MNDFAPYYWEGQKQTPQGWHYRIRLAEHPLYPSDEAVDEGSSEMPEATMFSYSYLGMGGASEGTNGEDDTRPVIFAYNGGPGAASAWLHMGLLGPTLVELQGYPEDASHPAEYKLIPNPDFLLDRYDVVLIDPVGTGWARLLDESAASRHYSTAGDARDFADFISTWLKENHREKSPVYLLGESYGTIRNVALADVIPEHIHLQGIIHIGTSLNVGARTPLLVEPNVRRLGANAATCWYHHHQKDGDRDSFVRDAMAFAYGDYAHALLMGSRLPVESRKSVLERLSYFTGMDRGFLDEHNLRFSEVDFLLGCCPGSVVSTYDARLLYHPKVTEKYSENNMDTAGIIEPDMKQDAFMAAVGPTYDVALHEYIEQELVSPHWEMASDMMSIALRWDYQGYEKDTLTLPVELMKRRPELRMLFVNGYYDMQSTFDFVTYYLSQFDLPADRVMQVVLPAGHAAYVGEGMAERLTEEVRRFVEQ